MLCRGKGLGKEEDGRTSALISTQKQDSKGIGFGTEGAFKPWWDDLYNSTAVSVKVKKERKLKERKLKDKKEKKLKDKKEKRDKASKKKTSKKSKEKKKSQK